MDEFQIGYADGSSSNGSYFTDVVTVGDSKLDALVLGLGVETDINYGLVGVGFPSNEAVTELDPELEYPNMPIQLQKGGQIASVGYSLWLNDLRGSPAFLLHGRPDPRKY